VREVIDPLVFIEALVEISLATAACPEQVPLMGLRVAEPVCFTQAPYQLGVTLENLVQELAVVNVIATCAFALMMAVRGSWGSIHQQLGFVNALEIDILIDPTFHFILT